MIVALIDNGSLEPAAQHNLRAGAAALSEQVGVTVNPVSWKHSDRVPASALDGTPAWTLAPWVRAQVARGERDFVFVPFFISAQGAIGSALCGDLEKIQSEIGDITCAFTAGLAAREAVAGIVADRVREIIAARPLVRPPVIVVDHGGPSAVSAALRDALVAEVASLLGTEISAVVAASMEGQHGPLLSAALGAPGFDRGDVIVAPLFLSPGRHAGSDGDLARIVRAAITGSVEQAAERPPTRRCHFTDLVGTHPRSVEVLATALRDFLRRLPVPVRVSA